MKKKLLKLENITFLFALLGLLAGAAAPEFSLKISFLGDVFLQLLKMMIIPLIFVSVFLAVAKQATKGELSSIGIKTFGYFILTSALACVTGLIAAKLLPAVSSVAEYDSYNPGKLGDVSFAKILLSFFTENPFRALAEGQIIQIVVFSVILGVACVRLEDKKKSTLLNVFDAAHDLLMVVIHWILILAPVGVFALVATVVAKTDLKSFSGLGFFFIAVASAALFHCLITLPAIGFFVGRFHPYRFIVNVKEALIVAFATASSSATLPVSTSVLEEQERVSPKTTGFVLPIGATLNMDGSALYQALVVLFLGGIAGMEFTFAQQVTIFLFVLLSSAGTAGIPGGGILMMSAILQMVGVPLELLGVYLLVDRFWDPPITAINVMGDLFGAKTIDRFVK